MNPLTEPVYLLKRIESLQIDKLKTLVNHVPSNVYNYIWGCATYPSAKDTRNGIVAADMPAECRQ